MSIYQRKKALKTDSKRIRRRNEPLHAVTNENWGTGRQVMGD